MSKPDWHRDLPWRSIRHLFFMYRRYAFSAPRPEGLYLVSGDAVHPSNLEQRIRVSLARQGFRPQPLSYDKGESINLAKTVYAPSNGLTWFQRHIRVWEDDGEYWIRCHYEPAPEYHPKAHLRGEQFQVQFQEVRRILNKANIGYREKTWVR